MTQAATITFNKSDNATSVSYAVTASQIGKTVWRETGAANLLAATILSAIVLPVKKGSQQLRKRVSIVTPIMETVTGANSSGYTAGPKVAFLIGANIDFTTHLRATEAQNLELMNIIYRLSYPGFSDYGGQISKFLVKDESIN
jgi:hypothetical protein